MRSVVTLDALSTFVVLAEELHFTRSALRLHVAQPALTKRIQQLEAALGVGLFARTRRSVRLTAEGEALLEGARDVLNASKLLTATADGLRDGRTKRLRIGFTPSAPHHVLPALMRDFRRTHPEAVCVLAEANSEDQARQLLADDLDVGILRPPVPCPRDLVCTAFLEEPFVVVLPRDHPLARCRSLALTALAGEPFVLIARKVVATIPNQILGACAAAGFTPRTIQEASHIHAVVALVAAGCGVSLLPASASQLGLKDVVCRPLNPATLRTVMAIARPRRPASPLVRAFVQSATSLFARH